jgi:DNA-binding transcriptional MerR regulator
MYPIAVVARRAGLSPEVLRAWERRYTGIAPDRDSSGRRVYSSELLTRITQISRLREQGYRVSDVVALPALELSALLKDEQPQPQKKRSESFFATHRTWQEDTEAVHDAVTAIKTCNITALHSACEQALLRLGHLDVTDGFVFPVMKLLKQHRREGTCEEYHLSFARSALRAFVSGFLIMNTKAPEGTRAQRVVVATPPGYPSDLGAIGSAVHIQAAGWQPIVLGAEIDPLDLVKALHLSGATAVLITAVSEGYNLRMAGNMIRYRQILDPRIPVYFGGRLPHRMIAYLVTEGLLPLSSMSHLRESFQQKLHKQTEG